jgi:uncharacterized membrane protein YedE/YeeE
MQLLPYVAVGTAFGALLIEAEVVSWFRIQEMFRFDAFHMYGIIATAVATAALSLAAIRRLGLRTADGRPLGVPAKHFGRGVRYAAGGALFGVGWALTGACPGPMAALPVAGFPVMIVAIASALAGTWTYGLLRPRLPH